MSDPSTVWRERLRAAMDGIRFEPSGGALSVDLAHDLAEERAAILEYEAGLPRDEAARRAFAALGLPPPISARGPA